MAEAGNAHGSWFSAFLKLDWRTQIAIVLAFPALIGGGGTVVTQFFKPDPAMAEIRNVLEEHRDESRAINATLITKLDTLNTTAGKISNAMYYNICVTSQGREWLVQMGSRGERFCASITRLIEEEIGQGAYSR